MTVLKDGGSFGAPPEDAPREVSQPLQPDLIAQQLAMAAQNEQVLPPFKPGPAVGSPLSGPPIGPPGALPLPAALKSRVLKRSASVRPGVVDTPAETVVPSGVPPAVLTPPAPTSLATQATAVIPAETVPVAAASDPPLGPVLEHMRAASDTDSPSRGQPTFDVDPGKRITGGFGEPSDGQYFPLDGAELRVIVERLLGDLHRRIQDDLRFSMALTYPRVRARVDITIEAYAADGGFRVPQVAVPHERTPVDVAKLHGHEVVFCVSAVRQEFDADNQPEDAPNAMRLETGQPVPRKQRIETASGTTYADR